MSSILSTDRLAPAEREAYWRRVMPRIKDYIRRHLDDPALDPARIAAAVHTSTRYLHKLFEAEHHTVALYVKGLRLDRARHDLLDPRLTHRPIAAIAHARGFHDLSGFNRAFKAAYGVSPKDLRAPIARTPSP